MASSPQDNRAEVEAAPEEEAAPRDLNRLEILHGLRISLWEAGFSTVWATLTTGAFLTGFALWLGADSVVMGFLTAIPTFAGLIQVVSSYFGERRSERKRFTAWFSVIARTLWLPILLLPLLLPRSAALYPFLLLFALSYVLLNVPIPAFLSWMSDLVPPDHRGRFFGQRNVVAGVVGMVIALPAAWFLDAARDRHAEAWGFGVLFGLGVIAGLLSFACLLRQPEPPKRPSPLAATSGGLAGVLAFYRTPLADRNFRRLMLFNTVFSVGQNFAAPFFLVYGLENLHFTYVWLQIFAVLTGLATLTATPLWGYLSDRFGNKPLLILATFGVFLLPLGWTLTIPDRLAYNLILIGLNNMAGGLFWSGVSLTQFNLLISLSPPQRTSVYVAAMAAVTGLAGGLAPLAGSALMRALEGWQGHLFGLTLLNYHVTFCIAALLRIGSLLFLRPVEDAQAASARDVLQQLSQSDLRAWLHIRRLHRGGDQQARLRATEALAESPTRLAVSELKAALTDPSRAVRVRACRALAEIGDPDAVEALLAALRDPAAGLVEEAARALGRIGDRRANAALIAILLGDGEAVSRADRLAAARALAEIGDSDAVEALLEALETLRAQSSGDEEMLGALVRALGQIGDTRATPALAAYLEQAGASRPLRINLIRALGDLEDPAAIPALRATLAHSGADPILLPPLADALARLGDTEAALPLLDRLPSLESVVARKQVAHAVGALLGEGEGTYALLSGEDFARDMAVSRMLHEIQRRLRSTPDAVRHVQAALDAYIAGDYAAAAHALAAAAQRIAATPGEPPRRALCRRVLSALAAPEYGPVPLEAVLVAFFALQVLVSAVP
jgi:HEAT repeat protein/MFS family permease